MARKVLTQTEMIAVINSGGSVLINCPGHQILATKVEQVPPDNEILECFPLIPRLVFDDDDLNSNAIGILGKYFSGTPLNNDTIRYNSADGVWEFVQLGASGTLSVTDGGTGLSSVPNNSILYSTSINTFAATTVGSTLGVSSNTLNVLDNTSTQKVEVAGNANLFGTRKRINFVNGANTSVSVTDDAINNRVDIAISASASAGSRWDELASPIGNLTLNHGSSNTIFNWGNSTAGNSLLQLKDSNNNSGNGYILDINSSVGSSINPLRITAVGMSNGIVFDSTGKLSILGAGIIEASSIRGVSSNGIVVRASSNFVSRSFTSPNPNISISNGDGVSGDITINFGASVVTAITAETNLSGSIASNNLTLAWVGQLAKNRQHSSTIYNDQANTYLAGNKQNFTPNSTNAAFNIGGVSGNPSSLANGDFWTDSATGKVKYFEQGAIFDLSQLTKGIKSLINNTSISVFEVDLTPLTSTAMILNYAVHATDGTNIQVRSGSIRFSSVNKSGTVVPESYIDTEGVAPSVGTLTINWVIETGANKITLKALASSSLSVSNLYVVYSIDNLSDRTITKL